MRLPLFGKTPSPEEIEREVTEQIETLVRSGDKPPPPSWTLAGGLPVEDARAPSPAAPAAPPAPPAVSEAPAGPELDGSDELEVDGRGTEGIEAAEVDSAAPAHTSPARPRSSKRRSGRAASRTS